MLKRTLQIDVVKKSPQNANSENSESDIDSSLTIIPVTVDNAIKRVGMVICAYVILDTIRQVIVKSVNR